MVSTREFKCILNWGKRDSLEKRNLMESDVVLVMTTRGIWMSRRWDFCYVSMTRLWVLYTTGEPVWVILTWREWKRLLKSCQLFCIITTNITNYCMYSILYILNKVLSPFMHIIWCSKFISRRIRSCLIFITLTVQLNFLL